MWRHPVGFCPTAGGMHACAFTTVRHAPPLNVGVAVLMGLRSTACMHAHVARITINKNARVCQGGSLQRTTTSDMVYRTAHKASAHLRPVLTGPRLWSLRSPLEIWASSAPRWRFPFAACFCNSLAATPSMGPKATPPTTFFSRAHVGCGVHALRFQFESVLML